MTAASWWRTVLAQRLRVIAFDNRGVGRSDKPRGPYTLAELAEDAVAVLDAAGVSRAHLYGISMGGMVAQEAALRYPDRVRALVLGATSAGGERSAPPDDETLDFLRRRPAMSADEGVWASVPYNYSLRTRQRYGVRIGEDIAKRLRFQLDAGGYGAQLAAVRAHDAAERLGALSSPTLVIHGSEDRLVPEANGRLLADSIPGSELLLLDQAAHIYTTDAPEADYEALRFLVSHVRGGQRASRRRPSGSRSARGGHA